MVLSELPNTYSKWRPLTPRVKPLVAGPIVAVTVCLGVPADGIFTIMRANAFGSCAWVTLKDSGGVSRCVDSLDSSKKYRSSTLHPDQAVIFCLNSQSLASCAACLMALLTPELEVISTWSAGICNSDGVSPLPALLGASCSASVRE